MSQRICFNHPAINRRFLEKSLNDFKTKLEKQGITHKELLSYVAHSNNMSEEELINALRQNKVYMEGACWNGVIYVLGSLALGVTLFFTIVLLGITR